MAEYTLRKLVEGAEPSGRLILDEAEIRLGMKLLENTGGPRVSVVDGKAKAPRSRLLSTLEDVDVAFRESKAERVVIDPKVGPRYAVKVFDEKEQVIDTEGTKAIDAIYTAVHRKFDPEFTVRDMGIFANKPGEHLHSNAWDGGTNPDAPAEVQHARILKMATFLRAEGMKRDDQVEGALPVFGVIVLDKFWKTGMGATWGVYTGVKHVSHFHVAGRPSFTGHI